MIYDIHFNHEQCIFKHCTECSNTTLILKHDFGNTLLMSAHDLIGFLSKESVVPIELLQKDMIMNVISNRGV